MLCLSLSSYPDMLIVVILPDPLDSGQIETNNADQNPIDQSIKTTLEHRKCRLQVELL